MPHLQNSITKWWFEQLSLLGYIFACQCVVVEGWMSSRQVKAAAYKAAESRAGASGRGSRDASKKSANLACLPGPPLTINQPTKYTSRQYNQPTKSFIHSKKIKCYQFVVFLLVAANALNSSKKGNWRRTRMPGRLIIAQLWKGGVGVR